jgi:hypothetical protein
VCRQKRALRILGIAAYAFDVGDHHERARTHRTGDRGSREIGVDVIGVGIVGRNREWRDNRQILRGEQQIDQRRIA